jgi:hypothetical protein
MHAELTVVIGQRKQGVLGEAISVVYMASSRDETSADFSQVIFQQLQAIALKTPQ